MAKKAKAAETVEVAPQEVAVKTAPKPRPIRLDANNNIATMRARI